MFTKIKSLLNNRKYSNKEKINEKLQKPIPMFAPCLNQRVNYNTSKKLDKDRSIEKLKEYNKKGDKQLEDLKKADTYIKSNEVEKGLNIYKIILFEEGLYINSQSAIIAYLDHLYKLKRFDESWYAINEFIAIYPSLEKKYQDFRVRILKKEKKYIDALYYQLLVIIFDNVHYIENPLERSKYENKYMIILRSLKLEDKQEEIQHLIDKYTHLRRYDPISLRKDLSEIITNK